MSEAEQEIAELKKALADIHRLVGRGAGHGTTKSTADCIVSGILSMRESYDELQADVEKVTKERDEAQEQVVTLEMERDSAMELSRNRKDPWPADAWIPALNEYSMTQRAELLAKVTELRDLIARCKPHVSMSLSTTSGREFQETTRLLLAAIEAV
jgi:hypothetical protein